MIRLPRHGTPLRRWRPDVLIVQSWAWPRSHDSDPTTLGSQAPFCPVVPHESPIINPSETDDALAA